MNCFPAFLCNNLAIYVALAIIDKHTSIISAVATFNKINHYFKLAQILEYACMFSAMEGLHPAQLLFGGL